jgi:tRNA uridine 5-carbamoylmethylation protein Kti12
MRREVYQIARDQSTPLLVIWVKSSKECSWARNERRIGDTKSFVEERSFAAVVNSFQAPDSAHICDRYNIAVDSDDGSNVLDGINLAIGFISSAFDSYDTFVSKFSSDSSEKRQSEKLTVLQQMEELLRNIVSGIMKSVISSPLEALTTKQVSSLVAEVKVAASRNVKLLSREVVFEQINGIVFEQFQHQVESICRMHGYDESISSSINRIVMSIGTLPHSR